MSQEKTTELLEKMYALQKEQFEFSRKTIRRQQKIINFLLIVCVISILIVTFISF